jgi:uncharacterized protein (TIGR02391 family)
MAARRLDPKLMGKLARKLGKAKLADVNVMVSKRAAKLGVSSEAALVILARENGIGASSFQRTLDVGKQAEVRGALPAIFANNGRPFPRARNSTRRGGAKVIAPSPRKNLKAAIEYLIQDKELLNRCGDILLAKDHFDRPVNQATLVLEDRIRKKANFDKKLVGENLVNAAFKENVADTVLKVASGDGEDQRGYLQIMRGIVPAFRNKTHHHVVTNFSREDAMRVCGFIDVLLRVVDGSTKVKG